MVGHDVAMASYDRAMSLIEQLRERTGVYHGSGDGIESGRFVARIEVRPIAGGAVAIDYEASSVEEGVQHVEHTVLAAGPDGLDRLYIAHSESPFVTEMIATEAGVGRFVQRDPAGPYVMEVVLEVPEPDRLTYAWWWAPAGETPMEQSKADTRRSTAQIAP